MARASYSTTPLLRSLVHRPQGVILVYYDFVCNWATLPVDDALNKLKLKLKHECRIYAASGVGALY